MSTNAVSANLNRTFVKDFHGLRVEATLCEIRKKKVVLQCPERQDRYTIPLEEFNKKYRLVETETA